MKELMKFSLETKPLLLSLKTQAHIVLKIFTTFPNYMRFQIRFLIISFLINDDYCNFIYLFCNHNFVYLMLHYISWLVYVDNMFTGSQSNLL